MEIYVKDMQPFVRYSHYFLLSDQTNNSFRIPYESRLFYVKNGHGFIETDMETYEMTQGDVIIINSGIKYRVLPTKELTTYIGINFDYTNDYSHIEIPLNPAYSEHTFDDSLIEKTTFVDAPELNKVLFINQFYSIEKELDEIVNEYSVKLLLYRTILNGLFSSVITKCLRESRNPNNSTQTTKTKRIIDFIQENYNKNITTMDLSEIFHYHPTYINRIIKKSTGFSIHQYILRVRISKAVNILMQQNLSINEIADMCGFYDSCHFSKAFKKIVGVNPIDYKKGHGVM